MSHSRPILRLLTLPRLQTRVPIRRYSTNPSTPSHTDFYKMFGRPIAKVLLIAMFTYQVLYIGWTKLEQQDIRKQRNEEVAGLEAQVKKLQSETNL